MRIATASTSNGPTLDRPWKLDWLTPRRCRLVLAVVLALGFAGHLRYLTHDCPIDLSGDEAHYWDWSRQLDLSYYSKGPLVAYIIRASCAVFGDNMPAVRLPALMLAIGTSILTYWLAARLFGSERVALGAVLLNHLVPMFVAGSVLMTIDPPFFFCWAMATCSAVKAMGLTASAEAEAVEPAEPAAQAAPTAAPTAATTASAPLARASGGWAWVGLGAAVGVGFLAKYAMFLWLIGLLIFLWADRPSRRWLRSPWPWLSIAIALLFTTPVIVWNSRHGWPSLLHVARQTGATAESSFTLSNFGEFVGGQVAALGPCLAVMMVAAVWMGLRTSRTVRADPHPNHLPEYRARETESGRATRFLICMGLPFWIIVALTSFRTKIQVNWPAPAYFSLLILTAYFTATRLNNWASWRRWRLWFWGAVGAGLMFTPIAHNTELLYRPIYKLGQALGKRPDRALTPAKWDPTYKLRGWRDLGAYISQESEKLGPGAFVMCEKYDFAAEMAFYVKGQPKTFYVGSWFADPERRGRNTQYDMWPDRRLDQRELLGKDAIFFGYGQKDADDSGAPADIAAAFQKVEKLAPFDVERAGMKIRTFRIWRCYGFKGMTKPAEEGKY